MRAIISGASKGIGKAVAIKLNQLGFDLILIARGKEGLETLKNKLLLQRPTANILTFPIDLSKDAEVQELISSIDKLDVNVVVNNVGNFIPDQASEISSKALSSTLNTNLFPAISITNSLLPNMISNGSGYIFNICSIASTQALKNASSYSISKAALKSWNDSLREELRNKGIKVSAIYPGSVNTSSWDGADAEIHKMIQTEDIVTIIEACLKISTHAICEEIYITPLKPLF